jgi:hypothetical protein
MGDVIQFPRPRTKRFCVTVHKKGGKRIVAHEDTYLASMDLIRIALLEHPDATRISVMKEDFSQ